VGLVLAMCNKDATDMRKATLPYCYTLPAKFNPMYFYACHRYIGLLLGVSHKWESNVLWCL